MTYEQFINCTEQILTIVRNIERSKATYIRNATLQYLTSSCTKCIAAQIQLQTLKFVIRCQSIKNAPTIDSSHITAQWMFQYKIR